MASEFTNVNPTKGKKLIIFGTLLFILGVVTFKSIGLFLIGFALIIFLIGRIMHWFYNA